MGAYPQQVQHSTTQGAMLGQLGAFSQQPSQQQQQQQVSSSGTSLYWGASLPQQQPQQLQHQPQEQQVPPLVTPQALGGLTPQQQQQPQQQPPLTSTSLGTSLVQTLGDMQQQQQWQQQQTLGATQPQQQLQQLASTSVGIPQSLTIGASEFGRQTPLPQHQQQQPQQQSQQSLSTPCSPQQPQQQPQQHSQPPHPITAIQTELHGSCDGSSSLDELPMALGGTSMPVAPALRLRGKTPATAVQGWAQSKLTPVQVHCLQAELQHRVNLGDGSRDIVIAELINKCSDRRVAQQLTTFIQRYGNGKGAPRAKDKRAAIAYEVAQSL
eukprot:96882-Amphidinium_carterae.2